MRTVIGLALGDLIAVVGDGLAVGLGLAVGVAIAVGVGESDAGTDGTDGGVVGMVVSETGVTVDPPQPITRVAASPTSAPARPENNRLIARSRIPSAPPCLPRNGSTADHPRARVGSQGPFGGAVRGGWAAQGGSQAGGWAAQDGDLSAVRLPTWWSFRARASLLAVGCPRGGHSDQRRPARPPHGCQTARIDIQVRRKPPSGVVPVPGSG